MILRYCLICANKAGYVEHPQKVFEKIGLKYKSAEPISMADCWILYGCEFDGKLPCFLKELKR